MAKLQRKSAKLFAEDATAAAGGLAQFGSLAAGSPNYSTDPDVIQALDAYKEGWSSAVLGTKSPAIEDRNALDYLLSYQQAYIMQRGVPEWLDTETYYQGSFASKADGKLYVSKVDNNTNNDPSTDTSETYWLKFPTPAEVAQKVSKSGDTMTGSLVINKTGGVFFDTKDNGLELDITPSTNKDGGGFSISDKNGDRFGTVYGIQTSQGYNQLSMNVRSSSTGAYMGIGVRVKHDGTEGAGYAPTPASASNGTDIATTAWVKARLGELNMLGRMNFNAAVSGVVSTSIVYTVPSKGYIFVLYGSSANQGAPRINGVQLGGTSPTGDFNYIPVSQGDVLTADTYTVNYVFVPQL